MALIADRDRLLEIVWQKIILGRQNRKMRDFPVGLPPSQNRQNRPGFPLEMIRIVPQCPIPMQLGLANTTAAW